MIGVVLVSLWARAPVEEPAELSFRDDLHELRPAWKGSQRVRWASLSVHCD